MASFLILVHSSNYACQSSRSALKYAESVVNNGHDLKAIFFYQEGVCHANTLSSIPTDELDTTTGFKQLNADHNIPLLLCVTAADKRGIIDDQQALEQAQELKQAHGNVDPAFTIAGLGEMATIAAVTDRLVQFK
ncbi:MAG: sulfurtransferase complex subunit TusD [Algicola sp.]|nr:sulfurtransferase complex subunit TusD [Algicola sp.]